MSARIDAGTRERLLRHVGLDHGPSADVDGLRETVGAFVTRVPFEDLAVQLGESRPLDPPALIERIVAGGRGGYCFEVNTVLLTLLESLGFEVERREAIVGERTAFADGEPTNHLALVAQTPDGPYIAEAGWGEGPVEPVPLTAGRHRVGAFTYELERDGDDGWWLGQHEHGSSPGFRFGDRRASLADFAPHHERLSTSPESGFVRTLMVQRPAADRIVSLRARTRFVDGPGLREREVVGDVDAFAGALEEFGIDLDALGPERLERLWARAVAQHEAHAAAEAAAGR
jgi:N-hydroxyarylamine O-acetyltransferase